MLVLVRNYETRQYLIFERPTSVFSAGDYVWRKNNRGNLEGYKDKTLHAFTWQPHGSQFTIIEEVPDSAVTWSI